MLRENADSEVGDQPADAFDVLRRAGDDEDAAAGLAAGRLARRGLDVRVELLDLVDQVGRVGIAERDDGRGGGRLRRARRGQGLDGGGRADQVGAADFGVLVAGQLGDQVQRFFQRDMGQRDRDRAFDVVAGDDVGVRLHRQGFEDVIDVRPDEVQRDVVGAGGGGPDGLGRGAVRGGARGGLGHLGGQKAGRQGERGGVAGELFSYVLWCW